MDVLVIAVCATIAGSESWEDMALYGRSKEAWLRGFPTLSGGIPSHDTFRRVFMLIDPDAFARCFTAWASSIGPAPDREVVAIDGKSLRRSFAPVEGLGRMIMTVFAGIAEFERDLIRNHPARTLGFDSDLEGQVSLLSGREYTRARP